MLLKQARYFVTVVDANSFTQAAERLFLSQSAISQQIKTLEEDLGVQLMLREKRKFRLTPAGEYFYRRCRAMVVSGQGFLPIEDVGTLPTTPAGTKRIPVLRHGTPLRRRYCAFWRKERGNEFVETFSELLMRYISPGELPERPI